MWRGTAQHIWQEMVNWIKYNFFGLWPCLCRLYLWHLRVADSLALIYGRVWDVEVNFVFLLLYHSSVLWVSISSANSIWLTYDSKSLYSLEKSPARKMRLRILAATKTSFHVSLGFYLFFFIIYTWKVCEWQHKHWQQPMPEREPRANTVNWIHCGGMCIRAISLYSTGGKCNLTKNSACAKCTMRDHLSLSFRTRSHHLRSKNSGEYERDKCCAFVIALGVWNWRGNALLVFSFLAGNGFLLKRVLYVRPSSVSTTINNAATEHRSNEATELIVFVHL